MFSGEVVLYNIFYEVFTVCTSIVAQDKQGRWSACTIKTASSLVILFTSTNMSSVPSTCISSVNKGLCPTIFCRTAVPCKEPGLWPVPWVSSNSLLQFVWKWMNGWRDEWMNEWMGKWMDRGLNEWMDGLMNGWREGRTDGWMNEEIIKCPSMLPICSWDNKTDTWGLTEVLRPLVVNLDYQVRKI